MKKVPTFHRRLRRRQNFLPSPTQMVRGRTAKEEADGGVGGRHAPFVPPQSRRSGGGANAPNVMSRGKNRVLPHPISAKNLIKRAIFSGNFGAARKFSRKIPFLRNFAPPPMILPITKYAKKSLDYVYKLFISM